MNDRICANCGREIADDERPWRVTGECSGDSETVPGELRLICEECYDERDESEST